MRADASNTADGTDCRRLSRSQRDDVTTVFHAKYWAHALTLRGAAGSIEALSRSIVGSRVDLNPHQVDAALFAMRSPLTRGVILADEVGLGKTIEAGIVISQCWAERKRRILVIVPATLRKQLCFVIIPSAWRIRYLARVPTQDEGDPEVGLGGGLAVAIAAC